MQLFPNPNSKIINDANYFNSKERDATPSALILLSKRFNLKEINCLRWDNPKKRYSLYSESILLCYRYNSRDLSYSS